MVQVQTLKLCWLSKDTIQGEGNPLTPITTCLDLVTPTFCAGPHSEKLALPSQRLRAITANPPAARDAAWKLMQAYMGPGCDITIVAASKKCSDRDGEQRQAPNAVRGRPILP